jgi:enoyl-CoA hydratase/carnithine racemase
MDPNQAMREERIDLKSVLLEKDGPIGWLILNRPDKRNALSIEMMSEVLQTLDVVAEDETIRALVIRGNGPIFSAGHDLKEVVSHKDDLPYLHRIFAVCNRMMLRVHELPQPVIAQVHGIATAAGCQLVAASDLAIAESDARFATPGVHIGLFCTTPMVPLVRVVGRRRAMEMLLSGRFISSDEALSFGLVNRVVAPDRLAEETRKWAYDIAQFSRFTLALGKRAFYEQVDLDEKSAYAYAKEVISMNCMAEDAAEGMNAFLEKRKPQWRDQ